jgi:pyruvate kinase
VLLLAEGAPAPGAVSGAVTLASGYERLGSEVLPGHRVLINDGLIRMVAVPREPGDPGSALRCRVLVGGLATSRKGINLPDSDVSEPSITDQDWRCVEWAVEKGLDVLAMSFVRKASEVEALKRALEGMCSRQRGVDPRGEPAMIPIVSKIEKPQALKDLDAIVRASDAIMVARGDLGVEMDLAEVPIVQKRVIAKADEWGKPCIVATQMLESMVTSASPTRAEAADVANAVLDHADAVMLSAETAVGKHPVLVVETMRRIIEKAEEYIRSSVDTPTTSRRLQESHYRTAALAHGAWHVAADTDAKLVVCWSQTGGTARYLSQTGLRRPIIAYTSDERQVRRMALYRGVTSRRMDVPATGSLADWQKSVEADLLALGWVLPGDSIVLLAGRPLGVAKATTTLAVHTVGSGETGFARHGI